MLMHSHVGIKLLQKKKKKKEQTMMSHKHAQVTKTEPAASRSKFFLYLQPRSIYILGTGLRKAHKEVLTAV